MRADLPKGWFAANDPALKKARMMLRRHNAAYVSNYLGMVLAQVESLAQGVKTNVRGRPPTAKRTHRNESNGDSYSEDCRRAALGSQMLLDAMLRAARR